MSEDKARVADSPLAPAERMELLVPGWRGYKQRDLIRQDDELVRKVIIENLNKAQEKIREYEQLLVESAPFDSKIKDLETLLSRMRTTTDEVNTAPAGMLSYYARFKFTLKEQEDLVKFDLGLLESSATILAASSEHIDIQNVTDLVTKFQDRFFERNKIFAPPNLQWKRA